jgi:hypothetical protein
MKTREHTLLSTIASHVLATTDASLETEDMYVRIFLKES